MMFYFIHPLEMTALTILNSVLFELIELIGVLMNALNKY